MTAKELKLWVDTLDPRCIIRHKKYGWEEMEYSDISAQFTSSPPAPIRTMEDVCNVEDAT